MTARSSTFPADAPLPTSTASSTPDGHDVEEAYATLSRHAGNPSAFLALNTGTQRFRVTGVDGLIAYRPAGRRHVVQLGGVFAHPDDQDRLLDQFVDMAREHGCRVVAVQLQRDDVERYGAHGFTVNQLGANYARSLADFG